MEDHSNLIWMFARALNQIVGVGYAEGSWRARERRMGDVRGDTTPGEQGDNARFFGELDQRDGTQSRAYEESGDRNAR